MPSVKLKFRKSSADNRPGRLFYRIIHKRQVRQINTDYRIFTSEWDPRIEGITLHTALPTRNQILNRICRCIEADLCCLYRITARLESSGREFTVDDIVENFNTAIRNSMFSFMENIITTLRHLGRERTAETYATSLNSFRRFMNHRDVTLDEVDAELMSAYESYLRKCGISANSSSFYMRNLRAVYNRAVDKELTVQRNPFKYVYTGVDKTVKRAVPITAIRRIRDMDLSSSRSLEFARDMFMFSFFTRGMSFVDMAYLRKDNLIDGNLTYRRRKTGQQLTIRWEKSMQDIVARYDTRRSPYLLPIINPAHPHIDERRQYLYAAHAINRSLKIIGHRLELSIPLTMYVARHAWASIARSKNIPLSIISEGMGHNSEATTRIYLASLDNMAVDRANSLILKSL